MIFSCSGIPLPRGTARLHLTRFVTSAHLVREFKRYRNRDDKLRVAVRLSDKKTTDGFLGLYDDDIAIVKCLGLLDVYPIDLNFKATPATSASPDDSVLAAGRAFMVPSLMAMHGSPCRVCINTWIPKHQHMDKAVLGGPLLQQNDARFLGMIYDFYGQGDTIVRYCFLPLELLRERLEHFGILKTAKTLQNKGRIDYTRGVSREQRAINRRNKLESLLSRGGDGSKRLSGRKTRLSRFERLVRKCQESCVAVENLEKNRCAIEEERFGEVLYDGEVPTFVEKSFGNRVVPGEVLYRTSDNVRDLSSIVVSLALLDGDKMIFACSGIPLPHGTARQHLTRFVTSAHLVREFKRCRNRDDKMRVAVRLSDNKTTDGFLGLYDDDIAIVTCLGLLDVYPIDLNFKATPATSATPDDSVLAAGRAYMVPSLMAMRGSPCRVCVNTWIPEHDQHMNKAVLGGPLLQKNDARFLGMIYEFYDHGDTIVRYCFLPLELLRARLELFGILNPKQLDFREYKLPEGVSSIAPSGFMETINRIKACGYPMPPPLVLEFNDRLVNRFEERFGELLPWKGYPYGHQTSFSLERVWDLLPKKVVKNISRCVVSLASFKGDVRSFVCTGLLIKWHGSKATRTVILTSASLVRDHDKEDVIDKTLTIEVFLPPNQRGSGTLEFYNLSYNIAIVSVKKNFNAVHTEDIFSKTSQKPSEKVVAIGRDVRYGPLMATIGEVKRTNKGSNVVCKGIWVSTCKIKKAGIGGPLINFDGGFVGMNFYDGTGVTPLLPKHKIIQVLRGVINFPLPSLRWPVAKLYWYHGALDVSRYHVPELIGRQLH